MATVNENTLKKSITSGEVSGLYVIAGEEKYQVRRLAKQLIQRAAGEAFPDFNQQSFTDDSSLDSIADAAQALPFFAESKCVSVADFDVEAQISHRPGQALRAVGPVPGDHHPGVLVSHSGV